MKYFYSLALLAISHFSFSQTDFNTIYTKARESYKSKDYKTFYTLASSAAQLRPTHQGAQYFAGIAAALNSKPEEAVAHLKQSILIDTRYDLANPDLASLKERPDFKELVLLQAEINSPIIHSDTALVIRDRQLHAEGIAYNPDSKIFYLGSIHQRKIVQVDTKGYSTDFIKTSLPEMASIFGLKLDRKRKFLWACSSALPETKNYNETIASKVYKFDLAGNLIGVFDPPADVKGAIFGDLVLTGNDEVYVSDSKNNLILKVNESTKKLDKFFESSEFLNLQGITFTDDNSIMFIADYLGNIFKLEMKARRLTKISCTLDVSVKGIDGLSFYKGSLIAIQNGVAPLRVVQFFLNKEYTSISEFKTIDRNHPAFNEPTLGTIDKNILYYIANSQWSGYNDDHTIKPFEQLQDIVILKVDLGKLK
ncbi:hypothetical protein BH10BAC4_BH10BAC4_02940 [soil metagenome]